MQTTKTDASALEMRKTLKAPVAKVFKAWTEPEQITKWFGCGKTESVRVTQDFRVGGEYRVDLLCDDDENVSMFGTFLEIERDSKLVYTWNNTSAEYPAKDTLVTVEFIDKGDTTEMILKHSKFDKPVIAQGHTMGWGASLDKFAALFAE